jgi:hypothetical protein
LKCPAKPRRLNSDSALTHKQSRLLPIHQYLQLVKEIVEGKPTQFLAPAHETPRLILFQPKGDNFNFSFLYTLSIAEYFYQ